MIAYDHSLFFIFIFEKFLDSRGYYGNNLAFEENEFFFNSFVRFPQSTYVNRPVKIWSLLMFKL